MIEELRAWAQRHTEQDRYSPVGIAFHWVMAALVLFQLGWGWHMARLPAGGDKLGAFQVHNAVGLTILVLAMLRLLWRLIIPGPVNDADTPGWQSRIASATHVVFYICFFGLPISGWMMWSAVGEPRPLSLAGALPWPQMPFHDLSPGLQWAIMDWAEDIHQLLILLLVILIPLHIGAALKHHFWDRHDVLRGMLPDVPDEKHAPATWRHKPRRPRSLPASTDG